MDRIQRCMSTLSRWKNSVNLNSENMIQVLKVNLEQEISKTYPDSAVMRKITYDLAEAYREEEFFWKQRSKEQYLKSGDKNTRFSQNCVKGQKIQNCIMMLKDDWGQEQFSEGSKGSLAAVYFRDLFTSSNPYDLDSLFQGFEPRVTSKMNSVLTSPVLKEEIKRVARSITWSNAGADGFTGIFYQWFWHIVGPRISEEIHGFFQIAILPPGWNHTQLYLLPKVPNPTIMKDMRPINLWLVHYLIVAKIISERLKRILPQIISDTQGAFVSGQLITDNIIVAHELVHGLRTNRNVAENFMAIKTDISKAYDRVEWSFLEKLMKNGALIGTGSVGWCLVWVQWLTRSY